MALPCIYKHKTLHSQQRTQQSYTHTWIFLTQLL